MKKIFAILALTSIMASCNDGGGAGDQKADSTATDAITADSSANKLDTATNPVDSTGKAADTLKK